MVIPHATDTRRRHQHAKTRIANRRPSEIAGARMLTRVGLSLSSGCMRVIAGLIASVAFTSTLTAQVPAPREQRLQAGTTACPAPTSAPTQDTVRRTAQDTTQRSTPLSVGSQDRPTIILYASASAREVRFASQPQISVRLCGGVTDSVRVLERRNLPDPVQPGATYRDVFIAVEIIGRLNAECLARRITGQPAAPNDVCGSISVRDSAAAPRQQRPPL